MTDVSVVIPVYLSPKTLEQIYQRIVLQLSLLNLSFEILFVEDGGNDNSWTIIQKLSSLDARVRGLRMSRNYGQHNAVLAGIRAANGSLLITLDDDLQHPPEEIPNLIAKIDEGFDVVYGAPARVQHGFLRNIASQITKIVLYKSMGITTARNISSFRIFRTELRNGFDKYSSPKVCVDVLLTWTTTKFTAIKVRHEKRLHGKSNYNTRKLIRHTLNMLMGFSTAPLKAAGIIGILFAFFGVFILSYVLIRYITFGGAVPGFTFIASIISIFSGVQLLSLGIIGEYLAMVHDRTMDRPPYLIKEIVG